MFQDQWLRNGRQPEAFNPALFWSYRPGNPIRTMNRAATPELRLLLGVLKPTIGVPKPRLEVPTPRLGDPKTRLGDEA